jgi:hypothetical protein
MRPIAGLLLTVAAAFAGPEAWAQAAAPAHPSFSGANAALFNAVFTPRPAKASRVRSKREFVAYNYASTPPAARTDPEAALAAGGVFALPAFSGTALDQSRLLAAPQLVGGQGLALWRTDEVSLPQPSGAVDSLRVSVGGVARGPGGVVLAGPGGLLEPDAEAFDLTYIRGWPSALTLSARGYDLDFSPHAGIGVNNAGGSAEAGAMVRLGSHFQSELMDQLSGLGLHTVSSDSLAGRGHWYLFAAASGRAVGMNMTSTAQGQLQRAGWSAEGTSRLIGDAQAGVGWRQGDVQASFGYVHRTVTSASPVATGLDGPSYQDSMVAVSLSVKQH